MQNIIKNNFDKLINEQLITHIINGLIVLLIFIALVSITELAIKKINESRFVFKKIIILIARVVYFILIIFGTLCFLDAIGVNITTAIASLGLTGFAIGFALRDALSNIIAGILVLIYKPFKKGDYIKVAGFEGKVSEIDFRYTTLEFNEEIILIPNASVVTNPVVVKTKD